MKATGNVLGHRLEIVYANHTRRKHKVPKIPKHPMQDLDQNMNELMTYSDLKIRWQWTFRHSKNKMKIARHWKPQPNIEPKAKPTCSFIWHRQMPHREPMPELPEPKDFYKLDTKTAFAVFKSSVFHQHKVTVGDLVQAERIPRRDAGEKLTFGTVLLVGSKNYTILGKPVVPYAKVKATVEQQTLTRECLVFKYRSKGGSQSKFYRRRQWVTMLRIDEIVLEPAEETLDPPVPKPVRLLDLWANRWLDPAEKEGIEMVKGPDGEEIPKAAEIYDGSEHQPGTYHRRGLTSCYRFWPDPQHTHWRW